MANATEQQRLQLIGRIAQNTNRKDWEGPKLQLLLELPPAEFGGALRAFINGFQLPVPPEPLKNVITPPAGPLTLPKTFDPAKFIGRGWTIWKGPATGNGLKGDEEQDARSLALTEVDFRTLTKESNFLTEFEGSETVVTGEVKRVQLIVKAIQADARIGQALYEEEGQTTLRWVFDTLGITWFELLGTTLRDSGADRYALYLVRQGNGSWDWNYDWLGFDRDAGNPALSLASKS